jgi:type VI secretion system protein ImpJ
VYHNAGDPALKSLSRVVWSEGMYIGPHHFQAQNRYFEDSVHFSTSSLWFEPYGFTGFQIDGESLRNGVFALRHARGVFPDGLSFHMPEFDQLPAPLKIADAFPAMQDRVEVLLAVPAHKQDGLNCGITDAERVLPLRYFSEEKSLADENTGRDAKPIAMGRKNIQFRLATESLTGVETLPLAIVRRQGVGQFVLDERFIAPSLRLSGSPPLVALLRSLVDLIREKAKSVIRPKALGANSASGFSAEGISNAWFLHCLNSSLGPLRHLCLTKRGHPEEIYGELSRLAGALCTFGLDSDPASLPAYDHVHPTACFEALDRHIREHLELIVPSSSVAIALTRSAIYFWEGRVLDERTLNRSRWIFAIRCPIGEADLIERTTRLVKICSKEFVPRLVERALSGLKLTHLPVPPPALSPKIEFQYFKLDKSGPCWEHLVRTRDIGVYVPGELPDPQIELSVILDS